MSEYNKYINSFTNKAEYETYINSPIAKAPNTALIDETGEIKMTKYLPNDNNNNYVMFGTTTGTHDFMIGSSSSERSDADCIKVHIENDIGINKMYVAPEDVLKIPKYFFSSSNAFNTTEGHKIVSIKKWKIDTSNVVSSQSMFSTCSSLTYLDLQNFITSNITTMAGMFHTCSNLTNLDLTSFDVSNVTNMYNMFNNCSKLTNLNLTSFDNRKLTDMYNMFYNCTNINKLYLSSSFFNSTSLTTYDFSPLSNWTDTETLAMFVEAITAHNGTGKRVELSSETKNALTTEQKTSITNAGWTIA